MHARSWFTAGAAVVALGAAVGVDSGTGAARAAVVMTNWTTYHANPDENGVAPVPARSFTHPVRAWSSPVLDGQIYGEPLVQGSSVVVATENDVVYDLQAATGTPAWTRTVGTPVPASSLPCGDISPKVGITGTPVIDPARGEVFVVADEVSGSAISHHLVGLSLATGTVLLDQVVDPPGTTPKAQLERPGLALDRGAVVIAFGGNAGDCSTYHGWVETVPEAGGSPRIWEVDPSPGNAQGAVWLGGAAPVVDAAGNVWVASGNGSNASGTSPDGSDSVVELSPSMAVVQSFTPSTWRTDNGTDADLGSAPPAVMGNGLVLQAGKSHAAYLLEQSRLGGVGGQVALMSPFCSGVVDGGEAFSNRVLYAPCSTGVMAVQVNARRHTMRVLWRTSSGSAGPPILAGRYVWTMNHDGTLYGLRKSSGAPAVTLSVGAPANHFPTPSVGAGLLLAAAADQVVAFR